MTDKSVPTPAEIPVPAIGEPEWQGEIADGKLDLVISGLLKPNQAFSKALARQVKELRTQCSALTQENQRLKIDNQDLKNRVASLEADL